MNGVKTAALTVNIPFLGYHTLEGHTTLEGMDIRDVNKNITDMARDQMETY